MASLTWYELFRDFQTLTVGLAGFIGVIITLAWNARLERRAVQAALRQRKLSVISALAAELSLYEATFRRIIESSDEFSDGAVVPRMKLRHFDAVVDEIGLLGLELSSSTLNGILAVEEINSIFAMLADESTEYNFSLSEEAIGTAIERMVSNKEVLETAIFDLEEARSANA
jgi:predicted transcriptional regulator